MMGDVRFGIRAPDRRAIWPTGDQIPDQQNFGCQISSHVTHSNDSTGLRNVIIFMFHVSIHAEIEEKIVT